MQIHTINIDLIRTDKLAVHKAKGHPQKDGFCLEEISNDNDISMSKFFWNYEKWAKYIKEVDAVDGELKVPIAKNYIL